MDDPKDDTRPEPASALAERAAASLVLLRLPTGVGSGFVVDEDGRVATSLHLISGVSQATVVLADGRECSDVAVSATDEEHDLAVLRVPLEGLTPLPLAEGDAVRVGERVIALGQPREGRPALSEGLVSAVLELGPGFTVLQLSAAIGLSGGPLLNDSGEVLGVSLGSIKGQNLAMPVSYLRPLLDIDEPRPLSTLKRRSGGRSRDVPHHDLDLLSDCSAADLVRVEDGISDAISVGAPLYNDGHADACYRIYQGAALDLCRRLSGCAGVKQALLAGVDRAAELDDEHDQAWVMRDTFDGVLDVISRQQAAAGEAKAPRRAPDRDVPDHPPDLLQGCAPHQLRLIQSTIAEAIEEGAPIYNKGDAAGCYRIYEAAARELQRKLPDCPGPVRALQDGLDRADDLHTSDEKAWAMRDAFDGLMLAVRRSQAN